MAAEKVDRLLLKRVQSGFSYVAIWQVLVFILLILLFWVNELIDIPSLLFGTPRRPPDITRGCLATAGILVAAIISVGNTYLQQRRIVTGILTICSYCKKIRIETQVWQQIEEFINRRSPIEFTHSICPDCLTREKRKIEEETAPPR